MPTYLAGEVMSEKQEVLEDLNRLALRAAGGDTDSRDKLFIHPAFQKMVEVLCRSVWRRHKPCDDIRTLDDLIQATYVRIMQALPTYKGKSACSCARQNEKHLPAWIKRIVVTVNMRADEQETRRSGRRSMNNPDEPEPQSSEENLHKKIRLKEAYDRKLSLAEQELVNLWLRGLNPRQIAELIYHPEWQDWLPEKRKNEAQKVHKRLIKSLKKLWDAL